jgi:hypothetical protein
MGNSHNIFGGLAAILMATSTAAWAEPANDGQEPAIYDLLVAEMNTGGKDHGAGMKNMAGMGHAMRPDMAPPQGVMGAMTPRQGRLMVGLSYMYMRMDGNRDGTKKVSTSDVLADFMVAPLEMDMHMIMGSAMYGITDDISAMLMIPYVRKEMDHVTGGGQEFTTKSDGLGDIRVGAGYNFALLPGHSVQLSAGLSLPTGSIDQIDDTPAANDAVLPYPMQIGSGTVDFLPGVTYRGRLNDFSWGAQFGATVRLGENSEDYALGNIYQGSLWGAVQWADWVSSSVRLLGEIEENVDGRDDRLNPAMVPTADPDLQGGERLQVGLGVNFMVPSGYFQGVGFSVEGLIPVYQNLDGPQLEQDFSVLVGLRKMF